MDILKLNELDSTVKSSYRTLAIFEYFAELQHAATVGEIAKALQTPQSSTSALLKSLVDIGFLAFDQESRTFEPTMRMAFLSHWTAHKNQNAAQIPSQMKKISDEIRETVVIAQRNGIYSQYIYVEHFDEVLGRHVETGSVRPLISSATGWSLLRDESDHEIGKLIRMSLYSIDEPALVEKSKLTLDRVSTARDAGFAFSQGDTADGAAGIAMNLPTNGQSASLAIAIAGPKSRILQKKDRIVEILTDYIDGLPDIITQEVLAG